MSEHGMNPNRGQQWFALTIAPQHELAVKQHLESKGYEASVPVYRVRRRWSDRVKTITLPLFPGYAFCRFAMAERAPVLNTPGVRGAVSFASKLVPLEDHEIERIHRMAESGLNLEPLAGLRTGMQVKILDGPLYGMQGVLAHVNGTTRVVVNIELLNRAVSVQVELDSVAPVRELPAAIPA
ncbi:MAG TPA: transcription termination/antitermination NusG family protein [Bryobacteraceae bacterium]|nr:transcription termination/antitermination NusG family protein [Bryobacteraceae bacterium]